MKTGRARIDAMLAHAKYTTLLPVYERDYRVHLGRGPQYDTPYVAGNARPCIVYWFGVDIPRDFLHELGHVVNFIYFPDPEDCQPFKPVLGGLQDRPWWWVRDPMVPSNEPDPFCEDFANRYVMAQLYRHKYIRFRQMIRPAITERRRR